MSTMPQTYFEVCHEGGLSKCPSHLTAWPDSGCQACLGNLCYGTESKANPWARRHLVWVDGLLLRWGATRRSIVSWVLWTPFFQVCLRAVTHQTFLDFWPLNWTFSSKSSWSSLLDGLLCQIVYRHLCPTSSLVAVLQRKREYFSVP